MRETAPIMSVSRGAMLPLNGPPPSVIFFGTFLSAIRGSLSPSELIASHLRTQGYVIDTASSRPFPSWRFLESTWKALTCRSDLAVLDVYSSRVIKQSFVISRILRQRRIPYAVDLKGGRTLERFDLIRQFLLPIIADASRTLTPSRFLQHGLRERGLAVDYLANPVLLERFPFKQRQTPRGTLRLLWVRAFSPIYRPYLAVETAYHLQQRGVPATLTMVGPDQGLLAATRARARELGVLDSVNFAGPQPNAELHRYYHSHDYYLNTTEYESFGVAIAEAASTGLPVVSAAVGEVAHCWQDGQNILLVPGRASEEFAERICQHRAADLQGVHYAELSRRGREKAAEFDWAKIMPLWEALLAEVRRRGAGVRKAN
jgi:glycosyltransferase involved in cell wall biosynthesis